MIVNVTVINLLIKLINAIQNCTLAMLKNCINTGNKEKANFDKNIRKFMELLAITKTS